MTPIRKKSRKFTEALNMIDPTIPGAVFWGTYDSKNRVVRARCKRKREVLSSMTIPPSALLSKKGEDILHFAVVVAKRLRESALRKLEMREPEMGDLFEKAGGR